MGRGGRARAKDRKTLFKTAWRVSRGMLPFSGTEATCQEDRVTPNCSLRLHAGEWSVVAGGQGVIFVTAD